jgi:hypothetical protein
LAPVRHSRDAKIIGAKIAADEPAYFKVIFDEQDVRHAVCRD